MKSCPKSGPCPYVSCKFHLLVDITKSSIRSPGMRSAATCMSKKNFDIWSNELVDRIVKAKHTCLFELTECGMTLTSISEVLVISLEQARRIEFSALGKVREILIEEKELNGH